MANTANLLRYARLPGLGWRRGTLVQAKNGRIKPNALLYGGVEHTVEPDNGVFQIRQCENGKNAYTNCGTDVEQALARLAQLQAKASLLTAQRKLGMANDIGNTYGKFLERDTKTPLIRLGFPIFDRHHHHRYPVWGYQGGLNVLVTILDKIFDHIDQNTNAIAKTDYSFDIIR